MNKYALDLDRAWTRILREVWSDNVPDILRWQDHKLMWPEWKAALERDLDEDAYVPSPPRVVDVSKNAFLTRPLAVLSPQDRVLLEAVVDGIAPFIEAALGEEVRSARMTASADGARRMEHQVDAWVRFQEECRAIRKRGGYEYMLSTDISGYFEYVNLDLLKSDLKNLDGVDQQQVELLVDVLRMIERSSRVSGLPQGPSASGILANLPLVPVDLALTRRGIEFRRWVDDFNVFGHSEPQLKLALQEMERLLRDRGLTISIQKTRIYRGTEIDDKFDHARMDAIKYGLETNDPDTPGELRLLFNEAISQDPPVERTIRFSVYRMMKLEDPHAVRWILDHLHDVPYLASFLVSYLGRFIKDVPEIEDRVVAYLRDPEQNIHMWAEMHLVRMLARASQIQKSTTRCIWEILQNASKDSLVRQYAARCVGRHPRSGDAALLRSLFASSQDAHLRRALLVAVVEAESGSGVDKDWLQAIAFGDPVLRPTGRFLAAGAVIPYP